LLTDGEKTAYCLPPEIQEANPVGAAMPWWQGLALRFIMDMTWNKL
jgi:hypothetical protein